VRYALVCIPHGDGETTLWDDGGRKGISGPAEQVDGASLDHHDPNCMRELRICTVNSEMWAPAT
jgi:hypothetical protein